MKKLLLVLMLAASLSVTSVHYVRAQETAGESFASPEYRDLMQMLYMMDLFPVEETKYVRAYVRLMYCSMYKKYIRDDFVWHKILNQTKKQLQLKGMHFRSMYQLSGPIYLGQYDFENQIFPLVKDTAFEKVGTMTLFSGSDFAPYCELTKKELGVAFGEMSNDSANAFNTLPKEIYVYLGKPFTFTHYKLSRSQAEKLLERMNEQKNTQRELFIRFRLRVHSVYSSVAGDRKYESDFERVNMNGELLAIDLFYDREMTEWIGSIPVK